MPARRPTPEGVTVVFLGTGQMDIDTATDLIQEYIDANISEDEYVRFVFPLITDEFSDTMEDLVEMAKQSDITYEVVSNSADKGRRAFIEISNSAARTYSVADVLTQLEQMLTQAERSVLMVLWDKERVDDMSDMVGKFIDAGIDVRDLTEGLTRIGNEEEGEGEAEEPVEAEASKPVVVAEEEPGDEDEGEIPVYARSDLEKLSRSDIKEIALKLGLPPRKASATMIDEIMEAQGEPEEPQELPETPVDVQEAIDVQTDGTAPLSFVEALDDFRGRLVADLEEFRVAFAQTLEGVVFNSKPEEPLDVESTEQPPVPRRRLVRSR